MDLSSLNRDAAEHRLIQKGRVLTAQPCEQVCRDLGVQAFDAVLDLLERVDALVGFLGGDGRRDVRRVRARGV
ncbi:hypothetical protein [Nocardia harenae]|uniref:hypothetical protein n=1 Tax=Nocardia harenae TaxID=358707 RepID=UPI00082BF47D|nr:hypothetical protein [Nocardia harenae]